MKRRAGSASDLEVVVSAIIMIYDVVVTVHDT